MTRTQLVAFVACWMGCKGFKHACALLFCPTSYNGTPVSRACGLPPPLFARLIKKLNSQEVKVPCPGKEGKEACRWSVKPRK